MPNRPTMTKELHAEIWEPNAGFQWLANAVIFDAPMSPEDYRNKLMQWVQHASHDALIEIAYRNM